MKLSGKKNIAARYFKLSFAAITLFLWLLANCPTTAYAAKDSADKNEAGQTAKKETAQKTGNAKKTSNLSPEDLKNLITTLEDAKSRDALIKNLRTIQNSIETPEGGEEVKKEGFELDNLLAPVDNLSRKIISDTNALTEDIKHIPASLKRSVLFFSDPKNYTPISNFLLRIGIVVLLFLALDKMIKRFKKYYDTKNPRKVESKVIKAFIDIIFGAMPYFVFLFLLVPITVQKIPVDSGPELIKTMGVLHRVVLSFYYITILLFFLRNFTAAVLAPQPNSSRLLPFSDRGARVMNDFAAMIFNYSATYLFLVHGILGNWPDSALCAIISRILILPFPFILTSFFLKLQRLWEQERPYGGKQAALASKIFGRATPVIKKYWLAPALAYMWLVSTLTFFGLEHSSSYFLKAILGTLGAGAVVIGAAHFIRYALHKVIPEDFIHRHKLITLAEWAFRIFLTPFAVVIALTFWGIPINEFLSNPLVSLFTSRIISIMAILLLVFVFSKVSNLITDWLISTNYNNRMWLTLTPIVHTTFKAVLFFIGFVSILDRIGVNVGPILAGAGILGLGVGMGAQSLVKDIINGLSIILSDTIIVGDVATVGGITGSVEAIGLRTLRIRDATGNLSIIPNSSIAAITNMTKHFSQEIIDIGVDYKTDLDFALSVLQEIGEEIGQDKTWGVQLTKPVEVLGVQNLGDSSVVLRMRLTCLPGKQWSLSRELKLRIKKTFDQKGINIPYPQMVIHQGA